MKIQPAGRGESQNSTVTHESRRVAFDPKTGKFGPMKTSINKSIDHMTRVGSQVENFKVPTDYTSQSFLTKVRTKTAAVGAPLKTSTQGVNVAYPRTILNSVRSAQRSI